MKPITVGSLVRAAQSVGCEGGVRARSLAVVATIDDETASLIWYDLAPRSLGGDADAPPERSRRRRRRLRRRFLVTPDFSDGRRREGASEEDPEQEEGTVPLSSISLLLPFELEPDVIAAPSADDGGGDATERWELSKALKEQGDALLRLMDPSAAATRYEAALALTSCVDVGGTIVVNRSGRPVIAEIDCVVEDASAAAAAADHEVQFDVTFPVSGEEATIREQQILLGVIEQDADRLQERILLNLSRCLLRLADVDVAGSRSVTRPAAYRKAAVLGCTLALTCALQRDSASDSGLATTKPMASSSLPSSQEATARVLRALAYLGLGKTKHAWSDVRRVLKLDPLHKEAQRLSREIEQSAARRKKTDRRLAKDVCRWVDRATNAGENQDQDDGLHMVSGGSDDDATHFPMQHGASNSRCATSSRTVLPISSPLSWWSTTTGIIFVALTAFFHIALTQITQEFGKSKF